MAAELVGGVGKRGHGEVVGGGATVTCFTHLFSLPLGSAVCRWSPPPVRSLHTYVFRRVMLEEPL